MPEEKFIQAINRILVVEDFVPFRELVSSLLHENEDLQVICEASDGIDAIRHARELNPDLILMDVGLPRLNGIDAARQIRKVAPEAKIIFLSQENSTDVVQEALNLGALGYIHKSQMGNDLFPALAAVRQGKQFVSGRTNGFMAAENSNLVD